MLEDERGETSAEVERGVTGSFPVLQLSHTRMYQHILSLCMFSVFGNSHGWLIGDNTRLADSFVLLSADWPSDLAAEHAE